MTPKGQQTGEGEQVNGSDFCQECERPATVMAYQPEGYCDDFFCDECMVRQILVTNDDDRDFDDASARAAFAAMLIEGSVVRLDIPGRMAAREQGKGKGR